MKSLWKDERGESTSSIVIVLSVFVFGVFYTLLSHTFNIPIGAMNDLIADGVVSAQTQYYFSLTLDMWKVTPFFMLAGLILYCYERSKGTEISMQTYFSYLILMMVATVTSCYMVYGYGLTLDSITSAMDASILTNVSEVWDASSERAFITSIYYYTLMLPSIAGSILYVFHPIIKQREISVFQQENNGGEGGVTDFSLNQF